jgi:hypothetical protein
MTEWHTPGEEPDIGTDAPTSAPAVRAGNRRQTQLLVLAGVVILAAIVLAVVVLVGGGSDGPAKDSPEATGDHFAAAVRAGSSAQVSDLSCAAAQSDVLRATRAVLGQTTSASRQGAATVQGDVAVLRLGLSVQGHDRTATLALSDASGQWCVDAFAVTPAP